MSNRKSKNANKRKRLLRRYQLRERTLLFSIDLICVKSVRKYTFPSFIMEYLERQEFYPDFLLVQGFTVVAKGTLDELEKFIERYWKIKAFA